MNLKFSQTVIRKIEEVIPADRLLTDPADLLCYSYDASGMEGLPMAAVLPADTGQVAAIVSFASRMGIPLFPRGAGSGTTGGSVPSGNGIVVSMTAMNRIININPGNLTATVEPGVITGDLQKAVSEYNLFYPPDPASLSFCTIGGNVNTGAGGARAVKYGVTRDYVTALEVVTPSGDIIRTGPETAKGVAGYDLTRLMVGSEGTLGIVTEITLRLIPQPEATGTALVFFSSAAQACCAVRSFFQSRTVPRCAEFFDSTSIACVRKLLPADVPAECSAMLMVEVDGSTCSISPQIERIQECCLACGALGTVTAASAKETEAMWKARRGLSPAIRKLGYSGKVSEDICVPRDNLPETLEKLDEISKRYDTRILTFGHAGDGNLHVNLLFDREDGQAVKNKDKAVEAVMKCAVEMDGTISGEHGIGLSKKRFMPMESGRAELDLMRGIKQVFDPEGILNPGKVLP